MDRPAKATAAACVLLLICVAWARAENVDRIVAVVNGDIILKSELQEKIRVVEKMASEARLGDPSTNPNFEKDVLEQMVRDRLTEAEVKRLKIVVSAREVDQAVDEVKRANNLTEDQLKYLVQQQGQSYEQFRDGVKKELERGRLLDRVLRSKIMITEAQVDAQVSAGKGKPMKELWKIAVIFIPNEGSGGKGGGDGEKLAKDVYRRLKEGADFARMAREYSKGPAADEGGDLGFISSDELAPAIASGVRGLKMNDISEPVKSSGGFYIVKIVDIQREKQDMADSGARERVRRQLLQQEMGRKFEEWIKDLESRAFIQISL